MKKNHRRFARLAVVPVAAALALGIAGPASAHVTVTPSETGAGAYSLLTFSVPHGCDGSATTKVAIKLPDNVIEATPTRNPFYDVEKVTAQLDTPLTAEDGDEITEKVDQIIYTAKTPLPDGQRDSFEVSLQIPEDAEVGSTLAFPTIQSCEQGETAWTEIPAAGAGEDSVEHPAPAFEVTAGGGEDDHGSGQMDDSSAGPAAEASSPSTTTSTTTPAASDSAEDADGGGKGFGIAGLIAGVLGLALGGVALARTRGRTSA